MSVRSVAQEATNAARPGWDGRCLTCPPLIFLSLPFCCNFPISPQILLYFFSSIQNVPVKPVKNLVKMKWSIIVLIFLHSVNGQFPNFLKAFYGGSSSSTTKKPPILRRNFAAENALLDDPFNVPSVNNNGIITGGGAGPTPGPGLPGNPTFNNIPLSNGQLQNNYVVTQNSRKQSVGPSLVNGNGGGGIVNAPNSFSSSPSVSVWSHSIDMFLSFFNEKL